MLFDDSLVMLWRWLFTLYVTVWVLQGTETFTVVTYNVENYFPADFGTREAKSEASRMKVVEFLEAIDANVIALQKMGRRGALTELRSRLQAKGLDYPHEAWVVGLVWPFIWLCSVGFQLPRIDRLIKCLIFWTVNVFK